MLSGFAAPVLRDVDISYDTVRFNGSLMKENIFRRPASPEVDAAWTSLGVDCASSGVSARPLPSIRLIQNCLQQTEALSFQQAKRLNPACCLTKSKCHQNTAEGIQRMLKAFTTYIAWYEPLETLQLPAATNALCRRTCFVNPSTTTSIITMRWAREHSRTTTPSSETTFVSWQRSPWPAPLTYLFKRLTRHLVHSSALPRHPPPTAHVHRRRRRAWPGVVESGGAQRLCRLQHAAQVQEF